MATHLEQIVRNLTELYDFSGKAVIPVGAGSHQRITALRERRPIAIPMPYRLALL